MNFLISQWSKLRLLLETSRHGQAEAASGASATSRLDRERDGARDFDFLMGRWRVRNRRLQQRLTGSRVWDEFTATIVCRPILGGLGNEDEYRTEHWAGFIGMSFRFFDTAARRWSIYWVDNRCAALQPPVIGSFSGDTGRFEGTDTFEERPILVRFIWSGITTPSPRWEQAFSEDGGKAWETNWVMELARIPTDESAKRSGGGEWLRAW